MFPLLKISVLVQAECRYCPVSGAGVPTLQRSSMLATKFSFLWLHCITVDTRKGSPYHRTA